MEINIDSKGKNITKIKDIINIQRDNGSIDVRQVDFKLPSETKNNISTVLTKSLETCLVQTKQERRAKNQKKLRLIPKRKKNVIADVISWPSDSDITVLRMKMRSTSKSKDNVGNIITGDGLHQPNSLSMINLATLIFHAQHPSKQNVIEELLLPLTSWEHAETKCSENEDINKISNINIDTNLTDKEVTSCQEDIVDVYEKTDDDATTKSKLAKFLRLYFCPCCSCLYKIEKMRDEPSGYFNIPGNRKKV